ncbi:hypothetical protein FO519_007185 [Halicephalobus sp. NKZ332]|nr:hypothetical protein FO519_007185 [Halicephalobus sp. NKZ332]
MPRLAPAVLELARKFKIDFQGLLEVEDYGRFIEELIVGLINEERNEDAKSSFVNMPILLEVIVATITIVFKSELNNLRLLALEQNHRFCNENIDIVAKEISRLFNEKRKNDFIEELYYRLNEKERIFLFEEAQTLVAL